MNLLVVKITTSRFTLNTNNSPFKTHTQKRQFSSTPYLLNNEANTDLEDGEGEGWTDYTYKLRSKEKMVSKSILDLALLSFFKTILKDTTNDNFILLVFKIKFLISEVFCLRGY